MAEESLTFAALARDFGLTVKQVQHLAAGCGIPVRPRGRILTPYERDKIYDAWLSSNVPDDSEIPDDYDNDTEMPRPGRDMMILIDTSSLLREGAELFLKKAAPELLKRGLKIIVPLAVVNELNKKALQSADPDLSRRARNIISSIMGYKDMGVIAVYGDENDGSFADNVFHKAAAMFALTYDLTVITQDYRLGQDLLMMGHMRSVNHRKISVCKINRDGDLREVLWEGVK